MDINEILSQLISNGDLSTVANNTLAQFGVGRRQYLGAKILPEVNKPLNSFRESLLRYASPIANDGSRYSAVQYKKGGYWGSMLVELGNSDLGMNLDGQEYDQLNTYLNENRSIEATAQLLGFADRINQGLVEINEKHRWEAIIDGVVYLRGDNNYSIDIEYPSEVGQRATLGDWSDPTYDIFADLMTMKAALRSDGYGSDLIITSETMLGYMKKNNSFRNMLFTTGNVPPMLSDNVLNEILRSNSLPNITTYDLTYQTQSGIERFFPELAVVMVSLTEREQQINLPSGSVRTIPNTLGYVAVGVPQGHSTSGRVIYATPQVTKKPFNVAFEGWQTSAPVIQELQAFRVGTATIA